MHTNLPVGDPSLGVDLPLGIIGPDQVAAEECSHHADNVNKSPVCVPKSVWLQLSAPRPKEQIRHIGIMSATFSNHHRNGLV